MCKTKDTDAGMIDYFSQVPYAWLGSEGRIAVRGRNIFFNSTGDGSAGENSCGLKR